MTSKYKIFQKNEFAQVGYNKTYEKLVKDKDDFEGMIAYCLYKEEKRHLIRSGVSYPDAVKAASGKIADYKKNAKDLVQVFGEQIEEITIKKYKYALFDEVSNINHRILNLKKNSWFREWHFSGSSGIVGNIYTALFTAGLIWAFSSSTAWSATADSAKVNFLGFIKRLIGVE